MLASAHTEAPAPSLAGAVIAVAGAGGGYGRASADLLARLGAAVGVLDVDAERAQAAAAAIAGADGCALALHADAADAAGLDAAAHALEQRLGPCTALVNAAETALPAPLESVALAAWDRAIEVELSGAFRCIQAFGRGMLAREAGSIVQLCTAHDGAPVEQLPGAAGRTMLSRLAAVEWGARGVRVNSIHVAERADPQAVAAAVAFLVGDASSYVTGESFQVDQEVSG